MGFELKGLLFIVSVITLVVVWTPAAGAEIYKCTDEDGNVAYLQLPCPVEKAETVEVTYDADAGDVMESSPEPKTPAPQAPSRHPDEPVEACKKRHRDQIDEIDAEILSAYSPEQGDEYKERLLVLTQQLRACG